MATEPRTVAPEAATDDDRHQRLVRLFVDLAGIREQAIERLAAEHGPEQAARLWQAANDAFYSKHPELAHLRAVGGTEQSRTLRGCKRGVDAPGSAPTTGERKAAGIA